MSEAKQTAILELLKDTQGTFVYAEPASLPRDQKTFPTIYVQKHAVPSIDGKPAKILHVTLEWS